MKYPNVLRRYIGTLVDILVLWAMVFLISRLPVLDGSPTWVLVFAGAAILAYEPLLTIFLCTAGQAAMGIRIRDEKTNLRITFSQAYSRLFLKYALGAISALTIPAHARHQAIHDLVTDTIVLDARLAKSSQPLAHATAREAGDLNGIDGWLAFLIVFFVAIWPLLGLIVMFDQFLTSERSDPSLVSDEIWLKYKQLAWLINALSAGVSIAAGYCLWRIHSYKAVRFAVIALWVAGPLPTACHFPAVIAAAGWQAAASSFGEVFGDTLAACFTPMIWTAYLLTSKRVSNTYGAPVKLTQPAGEL